MHTLQARTAPTGQAVTGQQGVATWHGAWCYMDKASGSILRERCKWMTQDLPTKTSVPLCMVFPTRMIPLVLCRPQDPTSGGPTWEYQSPTLSPYMQHGLRINYLEFRNSSYSERRAKKNSLWFPRTKHYPDLWKRATQWRGHQQTNLSSSSTANHYNLPNLTFHIYIEIEGSEHTNLTQLFSGLNEVMGGKAPSTETGTQQALNWWFPLPAQS